MKIFKLAAIMVAFSIFFFSSCKDEIPSNSGINSQEAIAILTGDESGEVAAVIRIISDNVVGFNPDTNPVSPEKRRSTNDIFVYTTNGQYFVAPSSVTCNGHTLGDMVEDNSIGQYHATLDGKAISFAININGYLSSNYTSVNNNVPSLEISGSGSNLLDTIDKNNFILNYTGFDPNSEIEIHIGVSSFTPDGVYSADTNEQLVFHKTVPANGVITLTPQELAYLPTGRNTFLNLIQHKEAFDEYQGFKVIKQYTASFVNTIRLKSGTTLQK